MGAADSSFPFPARWPNAFSTAAIAVAAAPVANIFRLSESISISSSFHWHIPQIAFGLKGRMPLSYWWKPGIQEEALLSAAERQMSTVRWLLSNI
jgi:hypothetical protein